MFENRLGHVPELNRMGTEDIGAIVPCYEIEVKSVESVYAASLYTQLSLFNSCDWDAGASTS